LHGLKIHKYVQFPLDDYQHRSEELAAKELGCPVFLYGDVEINYNLPTKTTLLNSNGVNTINDTYYPFQAGYLNTELTSRNMLAFPVQETRSAPDFVTGTPYSKTGHKIAE